MKSFFEHSHKRKPLKHLPCTMHVVLVKTRNFFKFLFISSASKPAYERASEESSVFNAALRNALEGKTPANDLISKVSECKINTIMLETSVHQY